MGRNFLVYGFGFLRLDAGSLHDVVPTPGGCVVLAADGVALDVGGRARGRVAEARRNRSRIESEHSTPIIRFWAGGVQRVNALGSDSVERDLSKAKLYLCR